MMVEVEEIELDLALSIGGSFGKHTVEESAHDSKRETSSFVSNSDGANGMHEKREMQALRRMEAKKKREQKRERVREPEQEWERGFKREKTECHNGNGAWMMTTTTPFRVQQFATVQYLPSNNGFPSPCWVGNENNVGGVYAVNSGDRKPKSNGSSRCSSVVSDYQNCSGEDGGSSTDSHSHSVQSLVELPQFNTTKETSIRTQPEESASASSYPMRPKQDNNNNTTKDTKHIVKDTQPKPNLTSSLHPLIKQQSLKTTNIALPIPTDTSLSNSNSNNTNPPSMETKVEMLGKPPKPLSQTSSLLQMPYVSTKGNNGKTVNGFLYRYTKSEVSIVCVCHGSTFSPAEFVQHAGGTDTSHPLRHITVIPSAFA